MSIVSARHAGEDSYDIPYSRKKAAFFALAALHISTLALPPGVGRRMQLRSGRVPFGSRGQRIRLADGTAAFLYYQTFPPKLTRVTRFGLKDHLSMTGGSTFSQWSVDGGTATSTKRFVEPPPIIVATRHAQIIISPPNAMSRPQALAIARALRPV